MYWLINFSARYAREENGIFAEHTVHICIVNGCLICTERMSRWLFIFWVLLKCCRCSGEYIATVCYNLSVPVQLIAWKDFSLKWPVVCFMSRVSMLTHFRARKHQIYTVTRVIIKLQNQENSGRGHLVILSEFLVVPWKLIVW